MAVSKNTKSSLDSASKITGKKRTVKKAASKKQFSRKIKVKKNTEPNAIGFQRTLGISVKHRTHMIGKIRDGLGFASFDRLAREMRLNTAEFAKAADIPESTLNRRKKDGRLHPDESDRLVRLACVFNQAVELFEGDSARAATWFRSVKKALNHTSPLDYSDTEIGTQEVTDLIGRLEHGVFL